jgi:hypothetical protein
MLALTTYPSPRYLLIVLALAGDSTMTRCFALFRAMFTGLLPPTGVILVAGID